MAYRFVFSLRPILFLSLIFLLYACGGGGSEGSTIAVGQFKDSNVSGLSYTSGDIAGVTTFDGSFNYVVGQPVSFSLGNVNFGTATGSPTITPIDLVTFGSSTSSAVLNRVRLLMTLDLDNNPGNGIEISNAVQLAAESWSDTSFLGAAFETDVKNKLSEFKNRNQTNVFAVHNVDVDHLVSSIFQASAFQWLKTNFGLTAAPGIT